MDREELIYVYHIYAGTLILCAGINHISNGLNILLLDIRGVLVSTARSQTLDATLRPDTESNNLLSDRISGRISALFIDMCIAERKSRKKHILKKSLMTNSSYYKTKILIRIQNIVIGMCLVNGYTRIKFALQTDGQIDNVKL